MKTKRILPLTLAFAGVACSGASSDPLDNRSACTADFVRARAANPAPAVPQDGTCIVEPVPCRATCALGSCVVLSDAEIRCADASTASRGLRVATSNSATYVAAASDDETHVIEIRGSAGGTDLAAPISGAFNAAVMLSVDGDGRLHALGKDGAGGIAHALHDGSAWTTESIAPADTGYNVGTSAFELGPDGVPHALLHTGPDEYTAARRSADARWTLDPPDDWQDLALDDTGAEIRFRTELDGAALVLRARTGATTFPGYGVGSALDFRVAGAPPRPLTVAAPFTLATYRNNSLYVAWPDAGGSYREQLVSGTSLAPASCVSDHDPTSCAGTCETQAYGLQNTAFSIGRTGDGAAWLAYVVTWVDSTCHLGVTGSDGATFCGCTSIDDRSVGELHVLRSTPEGSAPVDVLVLPLEPLLAGGLSDSVPLLHLRASGNQVAVAARVRGADDRPKLRVITLSTAVFAN